MPATPRLPLDTPIGRSPDVVFQPSPEGGVLLHLKSSQYHGLNEVGALVWTSVDGVRTASDLVAVARERYPEVDADTLRADVVAFLEDMRERDLLTA